MLRSSFLHSPAGAQERGSAMERVAREDLVMFVNAAVASTGQREFRSGAGEQRMSLEFLHEYVLGNYRELYASTLALEINHLNAIMIVTNLLRTASSVDQKGREAEGRLIAARLETLPPQRVYAMIRALRRLKVNNRRTRAIIRDWVSARPDPAFDAVKYRRGLSAAARHAHLSLPGEVGTALFDWRRPKRYDTPILETWRRAHYEQRALYDLPYTTAEGLAVRHGIPRDRFLREIAPNLTGGERLRLQQTAERHQQTAAFALDLGRTPLTRLAIYVLSLPRPERAKRRDELTAALRESARRAAGRWAGSWDPVVAVLDDSYSAYGSGVKRRRPLAVALAVHFMLEALSRDYTGLWLHHRGDPLLVHPIGATGLGERLVDALELGPAHVVVVSDGWDNAPPGLAAEVLRVWQPRTDTSVVHFNPVYEADTFDVRHLSPHVPSIGIRDGESVPELFRLAEFATGHGGGELRRYLDERVHTFLRTGGETR